VTGTASPSADVTGATIEVTYLDGSPLTVGKTYTLMKTAPGGSITGTFTLGTLPHRVSAELIQDGSTVVLRITGVTAPAATPAATTSIPTLSEWGLAALSLLLAAMVAWQGRRRWL
jgi:hypothetical protein